jgi:general stress protein YciG
MAEKKNNSQRGGDTKQHQKAGKAGGEATLKKYGREFYQEIGEKGGESQGKENNPGNFANDRQKASEAGRIGGQN